MGQKQSHSNNKFKIIVICLLFVGMAALVVLKTGMVTSSVVESGGLSGLVSVKGKVKAEYLNFSDSEIKQINRAVAEHRDTFAQVDLFIDTKGNPRSIESKTVLIWAMVLETDGDCEVRSWSRKIKRADLVPQVLLYMKKAAGEYEQFRQHSDVTQSFKCLYI